MIDYINITKSCSIYLSMKHILETYLVKIDIIYVMYNPVLVLLELKSQISFINLTNMIFEGFIDEQIYQMMMNMKALQQQEKDKVEASKC